jgi:hypothetical protein
VNVVAGEQAGERPARQLPRRQGAMRGFVAFGEDRCDNTPTQTLPSGREVVEWWSRVDRVSGSEHVLQLAGSLSWNDAVTGEIERLKIVLEAFCR